jgi:hypothetical protein
MDEILGNKFLLSALITAELTRDSSKSLQYDFDAAFTDIHTSIRNYYNSMTLDKRAIAIGTDGDLMMHELFDTPELGWKQLLYISTDYFSLMLLNIKKPTSSLIVGPDIHFNLVATVQAMGSQISFINNKFLNNFEKFALGSPEYPFAMNYSVYEYDDVHNEPGEIFDFITVPGSCVTLDEDLLSSLVKTLQPGGIIHIHNTNSNARIYGEDYEIQSTYPIFEIIDEFQEINSYHIPYGIGHNILVKNA